jgi:peptidoglycan/LPS O-acetylase OafA/YrhL
MNDASKERVNEIDLLRFIAAMCVVIFHLGYRGFAADSMTAMEYPLLAGVAQYGYLGVELFFMISGFVILMTAEKSDVRGFIASRIARLYPAFWVCCTITYISINLFNDPAYKATFTQYLINMTMLSGFFGVESIDGVYWSLFLEIQFYFFTGIVIATGKIKNVEVILFVWLLASVVINHYYYNPLVELLIANYSSLFIFGAACYLIWAKGYSLSRACIIFGSMGLAVSQTLVRMTYRNEHYNSDMSGGITVLILLIFFALMLAVSLRATGKFRSMQWTTLGSLTYPLYIIHQNVGYMIFNAYHNVVNRHVLFWGVIAGFLLLSYLIHVLVEKRSARHLRLAASRFLDDVVQRASRLARAVKATR